MGPNWRVSSGIGSSRNRTVATGLTTRTTRTVRNEPVVSPKTRHLKFKMLAPSMYLSSDRTMTWSVCTLCSFGRSCASHCQICNRINIRWVAIENPRISQKIQWYFTAIQRILARCQIWKREVEELVKLHNIRINHVMIHWDLRYLIGVKVAGTVKWNHCVGTTRPKHGGFMSAPGSNPAKINRFGFLAGSGMKTNCTASLYSDCWRVTWTHC